MAGAPLLLNNTPCNSTACLQEAAGAPVRKEKKAAKERN
jgi:hypothetical protein